MVAVGWIFFWFALARLAVALFNLASRPYLPAADGNGSRRKVSVLVPARNERENLERLLGGFPLWRGEAVELIVYDDMSTDGTYELVSRYASHDEKVRAVRGGELPPGWLGKNHACHCLAARAAGDLLLFVDADVMLFPGAVSRAAAFMEKNGLGLLSLFPRQRMDTAGSLLSVPLMNWILLGLLPLKAVMLSPRPSLAAANGQFMMFTRERYEEFRPHSRFRSSAVEDIAIIKYYKCRGERVATLLGSDDIHCRMYGRLGEAVEGFSKNVFDFFGGSVAAAFLFVISTTAAPFWVFAFNGTAAGTAYLSVIVAIRIAVSLASGQSAAANVLLMIPQHIVLWIIVLNGAVRRKTKKLQWKGRNISGSPSGQ